MKSCHIPDKVSGRFGALMPQAWQYRPCSAVAQELQDKGAAAPLPLPVAGGEACTASVGIGLLIEWA